MTPDAFARAQRDALATGREYAEGYVIVSDGAPAYHAWTVDKQGVVFDPLLGTKAVVGGYYGVPVNKRTLIDRLVARKQFGPLLSSRSVRSKIATDDKLGLDESVRELDQDGRLSVAITNISKANVCPYIGREIPGAQEMGLDPDAIYMLLRDPESLAAAAPSFCNLPVLSQHVPVFAEDYAEQAKKYVVGATGSDCVFQAPYLCCSMKIWDGNAIEAIMSGEQKELSCGYHYKPVMKAGIHEGAKYDGVMTEIVGNHVALVREGRAGADVVVGDSMENVTMKKPMTRTAAIAIGLIAPYVKTKLAADKRLDLRPVLCGLTAADLRDRRPAVLASIKKACRGKLASDTTLGEVAEFLDMLDAHGGSMGGGGGMEDPNMGGGTGFEDEDEAVEPEVQNAMEKTAVMGPEPGGMPKPAPGAKPGVPGAAPPKQGLPGEAPKPELGKGPVDTEEGDNEELKNFLKGKLSEEDFAQAMEMLGIGAGNVEADAGTESGEHHEKGEEQLEELGAVGGTPEEAESEGGEGETEKDNAKDEDAVDESIEEEKDEDMTKDNPPAFRGNPTPGGKVAGDKKFVTQDQLEKAMKASADAARKIERDIREAERVVQPWVGNLPGMTFDSAEQVYRKALKMLGVPGTDRVHESALRTILEMQPKPGSRKTPLKVAEDTAVQVGSFFDRYPDAGRIRLT